MYLFCINIPSKIDALHEKAIMDNFFSSVALSKKLRSFGTFTVGTQRSNSKKYPPALKRRSPPKNSQEVTSNSASGKGMTATVKKDTKEVLLTSIVHCSTGCDILTITQNDCFLWKAYLPVVKDYKARSAVSYINSILLFFHDILPSLLHPEDQLELLLS